MLEDGKVGRVAVNPDGAVPQLRVPKAAELLAARLRGQIVRGELKEGTSLPPEGDLMERFGVSRPTLREAVRVLEAESLLRTRRGSRGGAIVTAPDPKVTARVVGVLLQLRGVSLADMHEARMMIEPMAARRIAEGPNTQEVVETLREINEAAKMHLDDFATFPHLSFKFHRTVVEGTRNETLVVLLQMIADIIELHLTRRYHRQMTADEKQEQIRANGRSLRANDRLLRYLDTKDGDGAEAFWTRHLRAIGQIWLEAEGNHVIDLPD